MMLPDITGWPPKIFTPRRLLCESRPFFTLPSPFLCAMINEIKNSKFEIRNERFGFRASLFGFTFCNVCYFNLRISSAMPFLFMKTLSSFLFVSYNRVAFYMINDLRLYFCFDAIADRKFAICLGEQYLHVHFVTRFALYMWYIQSLVFFHFKLLAANFYYCYHTAEN